MGIRKFLALLLAVSLLMLPACSGEERSKSVEEAKTYDDLTMDFDEDEFEDNEDDEEEYEDNEDENEPEEDNNPVEEKTPETKEDSKGEEKEKAWDSYEERYKMWKEHERWRDKEVDKFKTAEEYADYYHDEYIALYMEQYYYEDDYDEGTILEQSYLDAIDHWEKNQPWPGPKK